MLIDDRTRFEGVTAIEVDEHVWRLTRHSGEYVTVIIDLPAAPAGRGLARRLDMVEGSFIKVFTT